MRLQAIACLDRRKVHERRGGGGAKEACQVVDGIRHRCGATWFGNGESSITSGCPANQPPRTILVNSCEKPLDGVGGERLEAAGLSLQRLFVLRDLIFVLQRLGDVIKPVK